MEMSGEARLNGSRQRIWSLLNEPEVLKACIPGCEAMEKVSDAEFAATVVSKVGPIKARFLGKVALTNVNAPVSYTLIGEGQGGVAGFAKAEIDVSLETIEESVTLLKYSVRAQVGGKLAQLGTRMIDATARKSADDFFDEFGKQVDQAASTGPAETAPPSFSLEIPAAAPSARVVPAAPAIQAPALGAAPAMAHAPTGMPAPAPAPTAALPYTSEPPNVVHAPRLSPNAASSQDAVNVIASGLIKVWISDEIAVVTLNRADRRNAMTLSMWKGIPGIFAALDANPGVRAIILTGAGDDFSAGADIAEFEQVRSTVELNAAYETAVDACCDAISAVRQPTIAVLKGYCLGGGAHLAMSCDFRYAAATAKCGIPAAKLSIIYGIRGTQKLFALVGPTQAKRILFSSERFNAEEGLRIGFVDHVSGNASSRKLSFWERWFKGKPSISGNDPMVDARAFAKKMTQNAPLSIAGAKTIINGLTAGTGALDVRYAAALIAQADGSEDYREGRAAFGEDRPPNFKGR